jgi:creatinine amidohydrolase
MVPASETVREGGRVKTELARMTWKEAEDVLRARPVALLPVGSLEQNGPQCPLGTDTVLAEFFARRVAEATGAVLLPPIAYGCSQAFQRFAGTIPLHPDTLGRLVADVLRGVRRHGVDHVLVVNNHGPNESTIEQAIRDARAEAGGVFGIVWPSQVLQQMAAATRPGFEQVRGHGGEPTTSALLAIDPGAVRMDLAVADRPRDVGAFQVEASMRARFRKYPLNLCVDIDQVSPTGVTGDPRGASADWGGPLLEQLVAWGIELVREFRSVAPPAP